MAVAKAPAFQFYPQDYLSSARVAEMTLEEEGVYIRLLCYCWSAGSIPADPERCARLAGKGCSVAVATTVQRAFNEDPTDSTRLVHDRLEFEREKQQARREQASEAGKKSAAARAKRAKKGSKKTSGAVSLNDRSTTVQRKPNPSSSSSSSSSVTIYTPGQDVFVPASVNTPEVTQAVGSWLRHLNSAHPEKAIVPNSPQEEALWKMLADWRAPPGVIVSRVNECIASGWANLRKPEPQGNLNGSRKYTSSHQTAAQRAEQANADAFAALQFADDN